MGKAAGDKSKSSKELDRTSVVSPQPKLAAVIEGRDRSIKECKFQRRAGMGEKCFEDLDQRRMGRPVTRTWSTDFLLREGSSREIGKWLKNKSIPWQRRKRLLQVVTGTPMWTADAEVWIQENGGMHAMSEGA
jgi:hypothetical protein